MFNFKHVLLASFTALIAVSCSEKEQPTVAPKLISISDANARLAATDDIRENVARKLAKMLNDSQFRAYLKAEVLKKFDGDYDMLLSTAMRHVVEKYPNSELATLASKVENAALLNIAIPVKAQDWNTHNHTPLVAFLPEGFDDKASTQIKAFDALGNVHLLDSKTAPTTPVIVVSNSERTKIEQGEVILKEGFISVGGDLKGARLPGDGSVCGTMLYDQVLYLTGFASNNLGAIESWANGAPEIRMNMYYTDEGSQVKNIVYGDSRGNLWKPRYRDHVDGKWWRFSDRLVRWTSAYGDVTNFALWEEDQGPLTPIDIEVKGKFKGIEFKATTKLNIQSQDEYIGVFPVDRSFCTNAESTAFGNQLLKFVLDYYPY